MSNFIGVRHVGLAAKNPAALAAFYRDVLGMTVVGETPADSPVGATLFLSRHPDEEDHEIVFFDNPALAHTALKVASLGELRDWHRQIKERGLPVKFAFNHGASLAFYFDDPEGHMIEIYWATQVRVRQPVLEAIDLDAPEEELLREVERRGKTVTVDAAKAIADRPGVAASGHDARGRASQGQALPG